MMRWTVTEADRDASGRILVNPFEQEIARAMTDVGAPAPPKEEEETPRPPWRPSKMELAGLVSAGVLVVAVVAFLNSFAPAPAPRRAPTAIVAATRTPTLVPTPTRAPTATATEAPTFTPEPLPTPEPVIIIQAPPCDPQNPPYQVRMDVSPIGHVVGFSCTSIEEATANAQMLADQMKATAGTP